MGSIACLAKPNGKPPPRTMRYGRAEGTPGATSRSQNRGGRCSGGIGGMAPCLWARAGRAAACGALDMVGTVWETTRSHVGDYPTRSATLHEDFTLDDWNVPYRGGAWGSNSTNVRCAARVRFGPLGGGYDGYYGFRVLLSPRVQ
ncbi:SUMF1/EgtB/PvdO family nonheme iron enzyme [bacterium]|nr:SUMF1/EgtB/PvdO family nonheme iron enzyme [bacterium]